MMSVAGQASLGRDLQYLGYAEAYTEAAKRLADHADDVDAVRIPFYHLAAHALELMLKAALSHQGRSEERLMMMGHSLERCYVHAIRGGADCLDDEDLTAFVDALDEHHSMQSFRYPQPFDWPTLETTEAVRLLRRQLDIVKAYLTPDR